MRRTSLFALPLLLAACGREAPPPPTKHANQPQARQTGAPAGTATAEAPEPNKDSVGAADVLRRYYALIEARRYADAWAMRTSARDSDPAQLAAHFKAYESYHSQVGAPSEPVASQGWIYVEVPVMTTGRFLGGKPFGSSGSVTLRRPAPGTDAPAAENGWRIYTG